jgi:hypothetical protein
VVVEELVVVDELELDAELDVSLLEPDESELDDESPPALADFEEDDERLSVL